jgi:hypothetical protein
MRTTLRILAAMIVIASGIFWLASGANRGWTKTTVPVKNVDEVTGIEGITYERRFVPGLEFLGGAWLAAVALAGASLMFRTKTNQQPKGKNP